MKAIIPAAGVGTRLRPLTLTRPKALLQVGDNTILGFILDALVSVGVEEVVIVVGFLGDRIKEWVKNRYDVPIRFVEQGEQLGLGHAVYVTKEEGLSGPVLMVLGDTIIRADLASAITRGLSFLGLKEVEDPRRFGVAEVEGERIVRVEEKPERPKSNYAVVGLYGFREIEALYDALERNIRDDRRTRGEFQVTDAIQTLIEEGESFLPCQVSDWLDCGKPETLLTANRVLLEGKGAPAEAGGNVYVPPVYIHNEAVVERSVVGPNVSVGAGARVRDSVLADCILNDGAIVENAVLKESLMGTKSIVRGLAGSHYLGDYCELDSA